MKPTGKRTGGKTAALIMAVILTVHFCAGMALAAGQGGIYGARAEAVLDTDLLADSVFRAYRDSGDPGEGWMRAGLLETDGGRLGVFAAVEAAPGEAGLREAALSGGESPSLLREADRIVSVAVRNESGAPVSLSVEPAGSLPLDAAGARISGEAGFDAPAEQSGGADVYQALDSGGPAAGSAAGSRVTVRGGRVLADGVLPGQSLVFPVLRAAVPADGVTITGDIFARDGTGLHSIFQWYVEAQGAYYPAAESLENGKWQVPRQTAGEGEIRLPLPIRRGAEYWSDRTFYLGEIPPSGCAPIERPLMKLRFSGGRLAEQELLDSALTETAEGVYHMKERARDDGYRQYVLSESSVPGQHLVMDGSTLFCYDHNLVWPGTDVRYIKLEDREVTEGEARGDGAGLPEIPRPVIRAMHFGRPGDMPEDLAQDPAQARRITQWAIWALRDPVNDGPMSDHVPQVKALVRMAEADAPPIARTEPGRASVFVSGSAPGGAAVWREAGEGYEAGLTVSGAFDFYALTVPEGVRVYSAGGELLFSAGDGASGTAAGLRERELVLKADSPAEGEITVTAGYTWVNRPSRVTLYQSASILQTVKTGSFTGSERQYQRLIGYNADTGSTWAASHIRLAAPGVTASLTLKKIAEGRDEAGKEIPLEDAAFTLEKYAPGAWQTVRGPENPVTTNYDGVSVLNGLGTGAAYRLTEISAPEGYERLKKPVLFWLEAENGFARVYRVNDDLTKGTLWTEQDDQGIAMRWDWMIVPNEAREETGGEDGGGDGEIEDGGDNEDSEDIGAGGSGGNDSAEEGDGRENGGGSAGGAGGRASSAPRRLSVRSGGEPPVVIPDGAVPLSGAPEASAEIPDAQVPLGALPLTGGTGAGVLTLAGAGMAAAGLLLRRKKKEEKEK